ncbi:MAG: NAD(P)/FAD-dependent oxidoreductase [Nannocystaceae bacterium]|nr:NAD(P)/FAD-dependent oxidoreductase [Nannocystaceae bacterium]
MPKPKIVIVGAGPSGSACALALARRGQTEVLLLDKSSYPRIKVCGSGLSPLSLSVLDHLEIRDRFSPKALRMPKLLARGPGGQEIYLSGAKGAWVLPRIDFDQGMVEAAQQAGATFQQETKVTDLLRGSDGQICGIRTASGEIEADMVVCANGSPARFSRDPTPHTGIRTIMGWWKDTRQPDGQGTMVWDRRLDGYYAWAFPEPGGVTNIGLTIPEGAPETKTLKALFETILEEHFGEVVRDAQLVGKWMGHPAVVTTKVSDTIAEARVMDIGEAARLVSPGTVEGISFALESGVLAADAIGRHFTREQGLSRVGRGLYRTRTRARMLPKFWAGHGFVQLMRSERARSLTSKVFNPQWLASRASTLLGEQPD